MKTFKMLKFAEDGVLEDIDDASFIARKFGLEDKLDFSSIVEITAEFLEVLLKDHPFESLDGRILNITGKIDTAFEAWLDKQVSQTETKTTTVLPPKNKKKVVSPPDPMFFSRPTLEGERYTPTRLVARLKHQLSSYIESAYPLSDPVLVRSRRKLIEEANHGHLLSQEPYVETTPKYKTHEGDYTSLGLDKHIAALFDKLSRTNQQYCDPKDPATLLYPGMWQHQAQAFQCFLNKKKDIIVGTGTGSGKTECFLVPILGKLYDEARLRPESFSKPGIRALILYPMNALVNDQLSRLRRLFGDKSLASEFHAISGTGRHPQFGMYTGRTPYPGPRSAAKDKMRVASLLDYYMNLNDDLKSELKRLGRYPAKDLEAFYAKNLEEMMTYQTGKQKGKNYTKYNWGKRLHTSPQDSELLIRQEMVHGSGSLPGNAPDILVTNYSMLEYMLMRPFERPLFEQTAKWLEDDENEFLLVIDEAHMYRGAKGAEVAFLLRRLRSRLGINDRPDKLRVICTSASLGSGEEALKNICAFSADLTGKKPESFIPITGKRYVPEDIATGSDTLAEILSSIDLDNLNAVTEEKKFLSTLEPLFEYLEKPFAGNGEDAILKHLYSCLDNQPFLNMLLNKSAGEAQSLTKLANYIFPDHPKQKKAVEVLITLGSIARLNKNEPGLIPSRIHAMFRGLNSIYACINPQCLGRQDKPGEKAMLGKLFSEYKNHCDACGARVFEIASCRTCGSPYVISYFPNDALSTLDFLWGETEGELNTLQLLPNSARYSEMIEGIRVHLKTGFIDKELSFPDDEVRVFGIYLDPDGERSANFRHCAMCQPMGSRMKSQISNFRTKGEQPFTALIEAQFSEQPPQKKGLANQGRKVLIFSDGRQKAARLAPALEYSHARDLFRQVIAIASVELKKQTGFTGMDKLYPAVIWVCNERGINLFPEADTNTFIEQLIRSKEKTLKELITDSNSGYLQPTENYARELFIEMTDRFFSINALGLGMVEQDDHFLSLLKDFPCIGLNNDEIKKIFHIWIRFQLEARRFLPQGADISRFGEGWEKPEGIDINNRVQVIPNKLIKFLEILLNDVNAINAVRIWFENFIKKGVLKLENDRYFLQPLGLSLKLNFGDDWLVCEDCGAMYAESIRDICPSCLGNIKKADKDYLDARTGFYRDQIQRAFDETMFEPYGLTTAEHSAQLTGQVNETAYNKTEKYELRFQDIAVDGEPPIDVLSCTTTMEVGIDIGNLSGVALRNVPPHVANYQQRAGRAGRRGRSVASVVTYAHGSSHDDYCYSNPEKIISGDVRIPMVYIENQQVLLRHINAYYLQRFFHESIISNREIYQLFESMGTVEQFLTESIACSFNNFEQWLKLNRSSLIKEVKHWAPSFSYGLGEAINVGLTVEKSPERLIDILNQKLPVKEFKDREALTGIVREALERQLEEKLLNTLILHAVLPRYAFPTDVVNFWVSKRKGLYDLPHKRCFKYEPQRDLQIALSEYAPGSSLTIDKNRYTSAAIFSPYAPDVDSVLNKSQSYNACNSCGYVSLREIAPIQTCPCCGSGDMFNQRFVTPHGFAPDINAKKELDRGEAPVFAGRTNRAQLEVQEQPSTWDAVKYDDRISLISRAQNLTIVNKGIGDRGFIICQECGRTEAIQGDNYPHSVMFKKGIARRHQNPLEQGILCDGQPVGPFYLGHKFITDVLLININLDEPVICALSDQGKISGKPGKIALISLVEAICIATTRTLQIEAGELSGNWSPVLGGGLNQASIFFYDLLPGGAGYTRMLKDNFDEVLEEAEALLSGCSCEVSCYHCLRHYENNFIHNSLDRHLALSLLKYLKHGIVPGITYEEKLISLTSMIELLRLKRIDIEQNVKRNGVSIPLIIKNEGTAEIWIDVYHPMTSPLLIQSEVRDLATKCSIKCVLIDSFSLVHDLPSAFRGIL